jgi:hypothetical protein
MEEREDFLGRSPLHALHALHGKKIIKERSLTMETMEVHGEKI